MLRLKYPQVKETNTTKRNCISQPPFQLGQTQLWQRNIKEHHRVRLSGSFFQKMQIQVVRLSFQASYFPSGNLDLILKVK